MTFDIDRKERGLADERGEEEAAAPGHVFVFRGRRGDLIKLLWWSGGGLCLFAKRSERGRFFWPQATSGTVARTQAQLSMLLEGIDWRRSCARAAQCLGCGMRVPNRIRAA